MLLAVILWMAISSTLIISYWDTLISLETSDRIFALTIFLIAGPAMVINNIACAILDIFLPEGWSDDDEKY